MRQRCQRFYILNYNLATTLSKTSLVSSIEEGTDVQDNEAKYKKIVDSLQ